MPYASSADLKTRNINHKNLTKPNFFTSG